ncbi:hypothetical protein NUACC21_56540 [Scytonema sp. NUACC21]
MRKLFTGSLHDLNLGFSWFLVLEKAILASKTDSSLGEYGHSDTQSGQDFKIVSLS